MQRRVIDLFAGCGGLSLGFQNAGFTVTHMIEMDKWSCDSLRTNFPESKIVEADIREVSIRDLDLDPSAPPDLIVGGPPCQGFSHSNVNNKDPKDPRNSLFMDFLRVVSELKPRVILLENVPGLLTARNENRESVLEIIKAE